MRKGLSRHASWQELLAAPPAPHSHILQVYDSDDFLVAAVGHFAAEGLAKGEAVLLTGTHAHLGGLRRELASRGVDAQSAERNGQLMLSDARAGVAAIVQGESVVPARFQAVAGDALARAAAGSRFNGVRWWGEMTNVLCQQGNVPAALAAEDLGDALVKKHEVMLFCSFLCDRFDPDAYDGALKDVCCKHSHVIPAEDYVQHRLAVNRAVAEVVGEIKGPLLQSLLSWKGLSCELPSSQVLLFWLRDALPERFHDVLARAKAHQAQESPES